MTPRDTWRWLREVLPNPLDVQWETYLWIFGVFVALAVLSAVWQYLESWEDEWRRKRRRKKTRKAEEAHDD